MEKVIADFSLIIADLTYFNVNYIDKDQEIKSSRSLPYGAPIPIFQFIQYQLYNNNDINNNQ